VISYSDLLLFLRQNSYRESAEITGSADFRVLGDTLVWWPITESTSYRYHFFGEELEKVEVRRDNAWHLTDHRPELKANSLSSPHGTIRPGEYIVHPNHGVGIFEYLATRQNGLEQKMFVSLQYAGNDRLLFPYDREKELMPYIGSRHPRLTRLYSRVWQNTKERVQKNLIGVARELLKIYATRQISERPAYPHNPLWQETLLRSAGFDLTEDQARAVEDIRHDLEDSPHPMDRLVCGDVGYGKTEVAMQAAAQVLQSGKQVAFIAPTTVLAEQHYALLQQRFADLPVRIEHLSRLTAGRDKEVLKQLQEGSVDMVVGTHRVLGTDVIFKDLGLLIIDEEQKFGVAQKERLKELRPMLDVLALSATPIPRTLSMSLSGLRGLSLLRTAPRGRKPVTTHVESYTNAELRKALVIELKRGGQCYVVHNRVQSLHSVRERVMDQLRQAGFEPHLYEPGKVLVDKTPEQCTVAIGHGQMSEVILADTMSQFLKGKIDILIASSIVEHGLDSPGANTLVVLHSEWFGLSDLYQLRGRVGRRSEQAYAHFFLGGVERDELQVTPEAIKVSETARERLKALQEADELGSGWSVAMRDLEIRGGGHNLGHEQHGSMEAIGLLLYAQLLQEEIGRQAALLQIPLFQNKEVS